MFTLTLTKKIICAVSTTFAFLLCGCENTNNCNIDSALPINPTYVYPNSITYKDCEYKKTDRINESSIINGKLIGFIIKSKDEEGFKSEYPDLFYYVCDDIEYYRHNGRIPLYSILGDDEMNFISNPEKVIYEKQN